MAANSAGCNLECGYCYQNSEREERDSWVKQEYDLEEMKETVRGFRERRPNEVPGLHGGETLLIPKDDLRELFEFISNLYSDKIPNQGALSVQTNGTLMDEEHIEIFKEYDVNVGISCDGPWPLNKYRIPKGANHKAEQMTEQTMNAIDMVAEADLGLGIIVVLTQANAGDDEKLEQLLEWQTELTNKGVYGHWNPGIPYDGQEEKSLSPERLEEVLLRGWEWVKEEQVQQWNPMRDYVDNLLGVGLNNCINSKCDPYNAGAAKLVKGNGETTGCGKTWDSIGDGPAFLQGPSNDTEYEQNLEHYDALKKMPGPYTEGDAPDMGGCRGCEYWNVCQGGCPGAGGQDTFDDGEYRVRTLWCQAVHSLYEQIERDIRALMPNVTLITDYPWNYELADLADRRELDIAPFAPMDPSEGDGRSSTFIGSATHNRGDIWERIPDEAQPDMTHEEQVKMWEKRVGEEHVKHNPKTGEIHADEAYIESESNWEEEE